MCVLLFLMYQSILFHYYFSPRPSHRLCLFVFLSASVSYSLSLPLSISLSLSRSLSLSLSIYLSLSRSLSFARCLSFFPFINLPTHFIFLFFYRTCFSEKLFIYLLVSYLSIHLSLCLMPSLSSFASCGSQRQVSDL